MTTMDRRELLRRAGMSAAGLAAIGGPMQGVLARTARAAGPTGPARDNGGYGPLVPVADKADGVVRLRLPEDFNYRSFTATGSRMTDGVTTPGRHDGMGVFDAGRGRYRLVRNHEVNGPGTAFGDTGKAYDPQARGGTTTVEVGAFGERVRSWVSCNGTQLNCAGGVTPWGTWITGEETVNGPDVGNDFSRGDNSRLQKPHGYLFEVPAGWGPGEHQRPVPIRAAGRFAHEAVAVDPASGALYLTEDDFDFPSGLYRYTAPANPMEVREVRDGGRLEMLAVERHPGAVLDREQRVGVTYGVTWVTIDDPDPVFPKGTTNADALQAVSRQGFAKGAAAFSRLEGVFYDEGRVYLVSTQGGDTPPGETPPDGYGDGFGQVWVLDVREQTLTLLFESPSRTVLELPDNCCASPRGGLVLCEDGPTENFLRGLTQDGRLFDLARNVITGREGDEFAGATFTPDGKVLFVNIQAANGLTFAIWGPWRRGLL